jgi:D-lyxose ketol-isomerase
MKRSEINALLKDAAEFVQSKHFHLPPFAYWPLSEWVARRNEIAEITDRGLGWDVTDFNRGDFAHAGLTLFTIRNGDPRNLETGQGKTYAEKILIVGVNQITPMHFHWKKMEDIINRGGGTLVIQLFNSTPDEKLADTPVTVSIDGLPRTVKAGDTASLLPGESITLPQYCYHQFWATGEPVLAGEVSVVNDDQNDNRFHAPLGRYPSIEEDEAPLYLLCTDYAKFCPPD